MEMMFLLMVIFYEYFRSMIDEPPLLLTKTTHSVTALLILSYNNVVLVDGFSYWQ